MTVEIARKAGVWSVLVNGKDALPNSARDGAGTPVPPKFLDEQPDLVVGVFALDVNGTHKKVVVDRFEVRVSR